MALHLKSLAIKSILNPGNISPISHVMENNGGPKTEDPDIREMVGDLIESNSVRREKAMKKMQSPISKSTMRQRYDFQSTFTTTISRGGDDWQKGREKMRNGTF
jgi:hypothetical protein